jgi:hypothetical protein
MIILTAPAVRAVQTPPPLARVTIDDPFWSPAWQSGGA